MPDTPGNPTTSPFWDKNTYADRRPILLVRARILAAWRGWFSEQDFVEVEPAMLQVSPGNEAHIGAFATQERLPDGRNHPLFLHTSPEFACKKLLAAGEARIFSLGKVFRNGDRGPLHHPEFTMLEWYRTEAPYAALVGDCVELIRIAARIAGTAAFSWRGRTCDPFAEAERLTVAQAFARHAGIDLAATLLPDDGASRDALAAQARAAQSLAAGVRITDDDSWSDIFSKILSECVEPRLGDSRLTVLDRYPASEAALARPCPDDPRYAERFELYACGVELANAFGELTDPAEQRRRFEHEMAERSRIYGETYPLDEDFLAALSAMPPASGIAFGVDRLVMLATGAPRIEHVLWTPVAAPPDAR